MKAKSPKTKGVAKVPVIMQLEALECGAASLAMVLAYYGKWLPLERVRADCGVSRDGSNALNIVKAARSYGLIAKGYRYEPEELKEKGSFPCIVHWEFNHFVVLDGFRGNKAVINDPARGNYSIPMELFDKSFTGICLSFEPGEGFMPEGKPKSMIAFARLRLKGTGSAFLFIALTALLSALAGVLNPAFSRVFLDRLLTRDNPEWLVPFMIGLGAVSLVQVAVAWIKAVYSMRIDGKLAAVGSATFMWKALRLPMEFFSQRMAGDIQQRQLSNATIAGTLVNTFAPLVLDACMMVFYLVVMARYSLPLAAIGVAATAINVALARVISKKRVNITRVQMRDEAKLYASTISGLEMIETIKSSGAENGYFERWAGYQASANAQKLKYARINQYLGIIPPIVTACANLCVMVLGVWLTLNGKFTIGMIMAFQGFLRSFASPAESLMPQEIDRGIFTGSLAVVDQDIILFEDTIANNIKMWDNSIEDFEMIMAARDVQLHEDIMLRDEGYQYRIREGGKDFSGGQRQRLEIARVLAQDPTIIIMDEATSALDAVTEFKVVESIKNRGITCIVIAHRLSTIRNCDEIIVLDKGKVIERGAHDELFALNGAYTRLVSSE